MYFSYNCKLAKVFEKKEFFINIMYFLKYFLNLLFLDNTKLVYLPIYIKSFLLLTIMS